jgi:hypothetical protein
LATKLLHPSAYWEFPIAHVVNFFIFLGALASFEFLLRQAIRVCGRENERLDADSPVPLPAWIWGLLGYSLFAWSTFVLINGLRKVGPDLCVAMFVYLDAGLLLRLRCQAKRLPTFLLLGLALGLGYYAKTALFPLALVFMAVAFFAVGSWRKALLPTSLMLLVFAAIAAPLVIAISDSVGHFTFGESGSNNYARIVAGEKTFQFYFSTPPAYLEHPLNLIHRNPNVFEFGHPFSATYPLWWDAPYWDAGFKVSFNAKEQFRALGTSVLCLLAILVWQVLGPIAAYLTLLMRSFNISRCLRNTLRGWPLLIPSVAGLCMYSLVVVVPRYIGAFAVLIWIVLFSGIRLQKTDRSIKLANFAALVFSSWLTAMVAGSCIYHLVRPLPMLQGHGGTHYRAAEFLNENGLLPGQAVAVIGTGVDGMFWARLARLHIVAQIPPEYADDFWQVSAPRVKAEVYDAFARAGAMAVVAEEAPPSEGFADWQRVGGTRYYVHFLSSPKDK